MTTYAALLLDKAKNHCEPANYNGLAVRLDVSRQAVSRWRNAAEPLPEDRVRQLARIAQVDWAEWWLLIHAEVAPSEVRSRVMAVLQRAGIAALVAIALVPGTGYAAHLGHFVIIPSLSIMCILLIVQKWRAEPERVFWI